MEQTQIIPPAPKSSGVPVFVITITFLIIFGGFGLLYYQRQKSSNHLSQNVLSSEETKNEQTISEQPTEDLPSPTQKAKRPTGPGQFACSKDGFCKDWDLQIEKENCTTTYADRDCLDQCADLTKRCNI